MSNRHHKAKRSVLLGEARVLTEALRHMDPTAGECEFCGAYADERRPYGRHAEMTCFECGMKPENRETSQAHIDGRLDRLEAEGFRVIALGGGPPRGLA